MKISTLELNNFRNLKPQKVKFDEKLNVLIGKNAQGKTNLLESIFLCAIGKSSRGNKDKDLIAWESSFSKITLQILKEKGKTNIEFYLFKNQNKAIKINGFIIKRMGELMGEFNAVYFSPDELKLVKESPVERRRFMDISLSQFNKKYFYNLTKYNNILQQRNKLLKTTTKKEVLLDTISIWNDQLAKVGAQLIIERINFVENIKKYASTIQNYLTNKKENLDLSYVGITAKTIDEIEKLLTENYTNSLDKDMSLGFTTVGPHRDDIKITLNEIDVRNFGSQGQQRTCALSLKLAELEVFNQFAHEYPVLLLDDVLSELDGDRQTKLLKYVSKIQTIITCTDFDFDIAHTKFFVTDGVIEKDKLEINEEIKENTKNNNLPNKKKTYN